MWPRRCWLGGGRNRAGRRMGGQEAPHITTQQPGRNFQRLCRQVRSTEPPAPAPRPQPAAFLTLCPGHLHHLVPEPGWGQRSKMFKRPLHRLLCIQLCPQL